MEDKMDVEEQVQNIKRERPNILITGTPGVGKTTLSSLFCDYVEGFKNINVGDLVNQKKLYKEWDEKFNVPIYDVDMVCDELEQTMCQGGNVIDFHSCDFFPERWFDLVVLLRCNNTQLYDRLKQRQYSEEKITENIECEILEVTSEDVYSNYKPEVVLELKNEQENDMQKNIDSIIQFLQQWKIKNQ